MKKILKENFIAIFIFLILSIIVVHACLTANSNFNNLRQRSCGKNSGNKTSP